MAGKVVTDINGCKYFYEYNVATEVYELVNWWCPPAETPDPGELSSPPYTPDEDSPTTTTGPAVGVSGPITLSATIVDGIRLIDNKDERLTCPEFIPQTLDDRDVYNSEKWVSKTGFPITIKATGGVESTILVAKNLQAQIPAGAVIQGIKVEVDRSAIGGTITADEAEIMLCKWWSKGGDYFSIDGEPPFTSAAVTSSDDLVTLSSVPYPAHDGLTDGPADVMMNTARTTMMVHELAYTGGTKCFAYSDDQGDTWTSIPEPGSFSVNQYWPLADVGPVRWMGDRWMTFVGESGGPDPLWTCWTSTDGTTWTEVQVTPTNFTPPLDLIQDLHYWSVSGRDYLLMDSGTSDYGLYTSNDDGVTWSAVTGTNIVSGGWSTDNRGANDCFNLIASGTTAMIVLGNIDFGADPSIYRITDTDADPAWSSVTTTGWEWARGIVSDGGAKFMIVNDDYAGTGGVQVSTDHGATWSFKAVNQPENIYTVDYDPNNSRWYVYHLNGEVSYSDNDGTSWTTITPSGVTDYDYIRRGAFFS